VYHVCEGAIRTTKYAPKKINNFVRDLVDSFYYKQQVLLLCGGGGSYNSEPPLDRFHD
jgi:hypothetical protein